MILQYSTIMFTCIFLRAHPHSPQPDCLEVLLGQPLQCLVPGQTRRAERLVALGAQDELWVLHASLAEKVSLVALEDLLGWQADVGAHHARQVLLHARRVECQTESRVDIFFQYLL